MASPIQKPKSSAIVFFRAVALIVATAIGAGMFGLPYVFSRSGVGLGLIHFGLIFLTILMTMLAFGEVASRTSGRHQMTGYARRYLGVGWEAVALPSLVFGIYGALIAYILGVGEFLFELLQSTFGGFPLLYSLLFWVVVSSTLFFGLRRVAKAESVLVVVLLIAVVVVVFLAIPHVDVGNLITWPEFSPTASFWLPALAPFGVLLFALGAATAVPETVVLLRQMKRPAWTKRAIFVGMLIPAVVYLLFIFAVVGVTGGQTTESAILGLGESLGRGVMVVGSVLGVITMTTSFLALGIALHDVFRYDFKFSHVFSWTAVVVPPILIVLARLGSFIDFIGLAGSLVGGLDGIIILLMYEKLRKTSGNTTKSLLFPRPLVILGMLVYALGILSEMLILISKFLWRT